MKRNNAHPQQRLSNGSKKCKRNCKYFFVNGFPKYRNLFAKGSEIFSQKRWSKIYAWEWISEKILKFWSRLPEIRISYDFEVPVLPRSGDFGLPKTFLNSWTWFSDFLGEADIRIAKISFFGLQNGIFWNFFLTIFWSFLEPQNTSQSPPEALKIMFLWVKNQATSNPGGGFRSDWYASYLILFNQQLKKLNEEKTFLGPKCPRGNP